jgi:hypothetical protein
MAQAVQIEWLLSGYIHAGEPLNGGLVYFYESDGVTAKNIFEDSNKSSIAANPFTLNADGKAELFADGTYTAVVKKSDGTTVATLENQYYFPNAGTVSDSEIDASGFGSSNEVTLSAAINSASGADRTIYLNPGSWEINNDLTVPSNINLKFLMGAYVTIAATKTLTIQGTIEAPLYNIFRGSGTVTYDDRTNIIPSIWGIGGTHDDLTLDGIITVKDGIVLEGNATLPFHLKKNEDGASTTLIKLERTSASVADNDYYDVEFNSENDNDQIHTFGRIRLKQLDVSDGTEKGQFIFSLADGVDGSVDDVLALDNSGATITGNMVVSGNLTVSGTTTTINSTTVTIDDPIFTLGGDTVPASDDNKD